jgi:hypothetical protein
MAKLEKKSEKNNASEIEENLENQLLALYGVSDLVAWRRACLQMEYLSSLWYQAQAKTDSY